MIPEAAIRLDHMQHIGGFGLPIGNPLILRALLEAIVFKIHWRNLVPTRTQGYDARGRTLQECWCDEAGQQEMAQMVGSELQIESALRRALQAGYDASVVHKDVQGVVFGQKPVGERANAGQ